MSLLRSLLTVLLLFAGLLVSVPAGAATASTTLLSVGFRGSFDGTTYRPAPGEVIAGGLARNTGTETLDGGIVGLPGGSAGLTFTPSADLTSDGAVTQSVAVEAVVESAQDGNHGLNTELSIAGGAYYRVQDGYQSSSSLSEFGMSGAVAPFPEVRGRARSVSDTRFDHITLIYRYAGAQGSTLSTYVDGCQVSQALVSGLPAQAAAKTIGFGNDVHPSATARGFIGKFKSVAVTTFTGDSVPPAPAMPARTVCRRVHHSERPTSRPHGAGLLLSLPKPRDRRGQYRCCRSQAGCGSPVRHHETGRWLR